MVGPCSPALAPVSPSVGLLLRLLRGMLPAPPAASGVDRSEKQLQGAAIELTESHYDVLYPYDLRV